MGVSSEVEEVLVFRGVAAFDQYPLWGSNPRPSD